MDRWSNLPEVHVYTPQPHLAVRSHKCACGLQTRYDCIQSLKPWDVYVNGSKLDSYVSFVCLVLLAGLNPLTVLLYVQLCICRTGSENASFLTRVCVSTGTPALALVPRGCLFVVARLELNESDVLLECAYYHIDTLCIHRRMGTRTSPLVAVFGKPKNELLFRFFLTLGQLNIVSTGN